MYLVVIAWMYVALMMAVAEANHSTGTLLGAVVTFVLYGLLPVALVVYLMGSPARRKAIKEREALEAEGAVDAAAPRASDAGNAAPPVPGSVASAVALQPDASGQPAADPIAPVRKEP